VGGKTQLLFTLFEHFPEKFGTYFEPFVGGGSVFYALAAEKRFQRAVLNDWNSELVNAYRTVQSFPDALMLLLTAKEALYKKDPKGYYYHERCLDPALLDPVARAARFIFLNKAGFNGLYRVNQDGGFNVPWGKKAEVKTFDEANVRACSAVLASVTLLQGDFEAVAEKAKKGDLVYFDPPYVPLTITSSFTSYTEGGFGLKEQERLAGVFKRLSDREVNVVMSNSDTKVIRDLYADFDIHEVQARRAVNSKGDKRGPVGEVIVVG
jgi:DNA adenine methylase